MLNPASPMSIAFYSLATPFYSEVASDSQLLSIATELAVHLSEQRKITLEDLDEFDMTPDPLAIYGRTDKSTTKGRAKGSKVVKPVSPVPVYFSDPSPIGKPNTVAMSTLIAESKAVSKVINKGRRLIVWPE